MVTNIKDKKSRSRWRKLYRLRMAGFMLFADLGALLLATVLGNYLVNGFFNYAPFASNEIEHVIVLLSCISLFMASKLYPGVGINPANEIRLVVQHTFSALTLGIIFVILRGPATPYPFNHLFLMWAFSFVFVLAFRWTTRIAAVRLGLWKEPVLVIGRGERAAYLVRYFRKRLRLGFWPVMVASDGPGAESYIPYEEEPVIELRDLLSTENINRMSEMGIASAVVDISIAEEMLGSGTDQQLSKALPHLIFVSNLDWLQGASLNIHDFEGLLGVETRKNELSLFELSLKKAMDLFLSLMIIVLLLPFLLLMILIIKLDSPGPIFYLQERIGKNRRKIKIIKFRTMVKNADEALMVYLQTNPAAKQAWEQDHKLKDDPRITRAGKWLRKFSLDELPQFFNVLKGELSLVGARPIVESEVHHYDNHFDVYTSRKPGLTGLWQVSGRNNTTYDERVRFDLYYVHNWSIWLDFYILLRTVWVVLSREGAY